MTIDEIVLAGLRGLHLAALSASAGGLLVAFLSGAALPGWQRLIRRSLLVALLAGLGWLIWQARLSGAYGFPQAQWVLLTGTGFGRAMGLRLVLLLAALLVPRLRLPVVLAVVLVAIALQPLLGHGAALEPAQMLAGAAHVLAGTLWVGSVAALLLLSYQQPAACVRAARRFSPVGVLLLGMLGAGLLGQWELVGGVPGLFGTFYGNLLLVKAVLLVLMLVCAGMNGLWLAWDGRVRGLRASLTAEAGLGLAVIAVAGLMATQVPGLHDRVGWPFPWRPVPGLWQDPFLRDRLLRMALPVAAAAGLILLALPLLRLSRLLSFGLAVLSAVILSRMPVFPAAPFLRPAVPTSFQTAETRRNVVTVLAGQALFARDCAACHGADATGAGPLADGDPVWPPDLSSSYFLNSNDGDWFWHIRHGMVTRDGRVSMPANTTLDDAGIWQVVDWLRANASARSLDRDGVWAIPPLVPALRLRCDGRATDLSRPPGGRMILLGPGDAPADVLHLDPQACPPLDAAAQATLALLAGRPNPPVALLIDGSGYLRQLWDRPPDLQALTRAVKQAQDSPITGTHH